MMFRAKAGSRPNAVIVIAAFAAAPHVNRQMFPPGSPKSIETIGAFQFFQQSQMSSPASTIPRAIAQNRSGGYSLQILNARYLATRSSLNMESGTMSRVSDSSNFINCQCEVFPPDLS